MYESAEVGIGGVSKNNTYMEFEFDEVFKSRRQVPTPSMCICMFCRLGHAIHDVSMNAIIGILLACVGAGG